MTAITSSSQAIAVLDGVQKALARCSNFDHVKDLCNQAEAVRHYIMTATRNLELQNRAGEVKLRCERRAGEILRTLLVHGGNRKSKLGDSNVTLKQLGLTKAQSSRWQLEATLPEDEFVEFVERVKRECRELTSNRLLRVARLYAGTSQPESDSASICSRLSKSLKKMARQGARFACIYAEPPWSVSKRTADAYLPEQLCNVPVKLIAAPQAHLHLCVPPKFLNVGFSVLRAWGFRYRSAAVRQRPLCDYGSYWRETFDVILLGVRGRLGFRDSSLPSWLGEKDGTTARLHALIERASPPPYLDLFGTAVPEGWSRVDSWQT
jgi:hypothetical protein